MAVQPAGDRILVATRKGLFDVRKTGRSWTAGQPRIKGQPIPYAVRDARTGSIWASIDHGHWGSKLARSRDDGATFAEVPPPKYPADTQVSARYYWVLQPGHAKRPHEFWVGTEPGGLFRTRDDGATWDLVRPLWDLRTQHKWTGGGRDEAGIHSILVDPRDPKRLITAVSCAGLQVTVDDGATWTYSNRGMQAVTDAASGQEFGWDPHCVRACAAAPDVLWQANHVAVYRSVDGGTTWTDLTQKPLVHFGFVVTPHPRDPLTAWLVPMESDMARTSLGGALVVMRTDDGGVTWREQRAGLPQQDAWDFPYRHAMDVARDGRTLAFGTTSGNLYLSVNGGEGWKHVFHGLPPIYSVRMA